MTVTIHLNSGCDTSRNVLAFIRNSGEALRVVEYRKTPPSPGELVRCWRSLQPSIPGWLA